MGKTSVVKSSAKEKKVWNGVWETIEEHKNRAKALKLEKKRLARYQRLLAQMEKNKKEKMKKKDKEK